MRNIFATIFVTCLALTSFRPAFAFTMIENGSAVGSGWATSDIVFDTDASCDPFLTTVSSAIAAAASVWATVPTSSLKVSQGAKVTLPKAITTYVGTSPTEYAPDGNPIVYCDTAFGTNSPALSPDSIPGFATGQNISATTGKISSCLLVLNLQAGAKANITSLDATITNVVLSHEIGHCLGLGHSSDPNALMYYATGAGRQLVLSKDDMDGITFLYPRNELTGFKTIGGCGAILAGAGGPGDPEPFYNGNSLLLMVALYFLMRLGAKILEIPKSFCAKWLSYLVTGPT